MPHLSPVHTILKIFHLDKPEMDRPPETVIQIAFIEPLPFWDFMVEWDRKQKAHFLDNRSLMGLLFITGQSWSRGRWQAIDSDFVRISHLTPKQTTPLSS